MTATATLSPEQMLTILADGGEHLRESLLAQLQRMANEGGSALLTGLREALVKVLSADSHHRVDDEEHSGSWTRSWQVSALVIVAGDDAAARRLMELYSDRAQEPNRWIRYWTLATANGRKEHAAWVRQRADALARDEGEHLMLRCLGWALGAELDDNSEALAALNDDQPVSNQVFSGGTDLLPKLKSRAIVAPPRVIDLKGIAGLDFIEFDPVGGLRIGANAVIRDVAGHELPGDRLRVLRRGVGAADDALARDQLAERARQ